MAFAAEDIRRKIAELSVRLEAVNEQQQPQLHQQAVAFAKYKDILELMGSAALAAAMEAEGLALVQLGSGQQRAVLELLGQAAGLQQTVEQTRERWPPMLLWRVVFFFFAVPQQSALHELAAWLRFPPYNLLVRVIMTICQWTMVGATICYALKMATPDPITIISVVFAVLCGVVAALISEKPARRAAVDTLRDAAERAAALLNNVPQQLNLLHAALGDWAHSCARAEQLAQERLAAMPPRV